MSEENKIENLEEEVSTAETEEAAVETEPSEEEKLRKELADTKDLYLRTVAEYDNFRKRTAKERDGIYADAYMDAIKSILPVIDNIERITAFASDEKMGEGINLIIASMKETLNKMGVTEIEAKTFDPNFHNAVMQVESEEYESGVIAQEFQKGYTYRDTVVRHSMVGVVS